MPVNFSKELSPKKILKKYEEIPWDMSEQILKVISKEIAQEVLKIFLKNF